MPGKGRAIGNFLLVAGAIVFSLALAEIALRLLVQPSVHSSGSILGIDLPPMNVVPTNITGAGAEREKSGDEPYERIVVNGVAATRSDLWGLIREDPTLAYAPRENAASTNGWWRSNNLGARMDVDTTPTPGRHRVIFFGDSYTQGSRVRQHETYVAYLNELLPSVESVNFGVDGYSTGQSFLRYSLVSSKISFDEAVLMIVPTVDLWRDISVSRYIAAKWVAYKLQPRFFLAADGSLQLARSPFRDISEQVADGPEFKTTRRHLLAYDRFYFLEYEALPLADNFVIARILRRVIAHMKKNRLMDDLFLAESESVQVTREIVQAFHKDAAARGRGAVLAILPIRSDLFSYREDKAFRKNWDSMAAELCRTGIRCVDLMRALAGRRDEELDLGYDGSHYGPKANRVIAQVLAQSIGRD